MARKISVKGRIKKLEQLQKRIMLKICPNCVLCGKPGQVVDHLFSRNHRSAFFERSNLNILCNPCHLLKTFGQGSTGWQLFEYTKNRLGDGDWGKLLELIKKLCPDFSKTYYLDMIEEKLLKEARALGVK